MFNKINVRVVIFFILFLSLFGLVSANTYYVDATIGNDSNDGLSELNAWQTISKINSLNLNPADKILFKRGEFWRETLYLNSSGNFSNRIVFGSYGIGENPLILGSNNFNRTSDWIELGNNIWKLNLSYKLNITTGWSSPGFILFDIENQTNMKLASINESYLDSQDNFFYNKSNETLIIYSIGNPATLHNLIEIPIRYSGIELFNISNVDLINLSIKYTVGSAIISYEVENISFELLDLHYSGGGLNSYDLTNHSNNRNGNGIELRGNLINISLIKNNISQIYDSAIFLEMNLTSNEIFDQINISKNIIAKCGGGIIFQFKKNVLSMINNILLSENNLTKIGLGWSSTNNSFYGSTIEIKTLNSLQTPKINNFTISKNNIEEYSWIGIGLGEGNFTVKQNFIINGIANYKNSYSDPVAILVHGGDYELDNGTGEVSALIHHNIIANNSGGGILIKNNTPTLPKKLEIYNNDIYENGNSSNPSFKSIVSSGTWFLNNIVSCEKSDCIIAGPFGSGTTYLDYNGYYKKSSTYFNWNGVATPWWGTYTSNSGMEQNSFKTGIDMYYPERFDFRLRPYSDGIDNGVSVGILEDFYGNNASVDGNFDGVTKVDIGAIEYQTIPKWIYDIDKENDLNLSYGILDVTLYDGWNGYSVDPTGQNDSTKALSKALNDAVDHRLVAFFPSGTYLISDTLNAKQDIIFKGTRVHTVNILGSTKGSKPVIKLANSSFGFNDTQNPKPVIYIWTEGHDSGTDIPPGDASIGFNQFIKNINVDVGDNNFGAVGIKFPAAQGSTIEDVKIYSSSLSNYHSGILGLPSRSMGGANIEIVGGMYGINYGDGDGCSGPGVNLFGLKLINQTNRSVYSPSGWVPNTIVGFEIIKENSPAIEIVADFWDSSSTLGMMDGSIKITKNNSEPVIQNADGQSVYFKNVYFNGGNQIIQSGNSNNISCEGIWCKINEYSYCDVNKTVHNTYSLINGVIGQDSILNLENNSGAPMSNIVSRHVWEKLPSFEDNDAVNIKTLGVKADGITDDTLAIQDAINNYEKIFLPKGDYIVNDTIILNSSTKLFGLSQSITRFKTSDQWLPTSQVPIISTVDDKNATTYLSSITTVSPILNISTHYFAQIEWKVGRNSILKSTDISRKDWTAETEGTNHSEYIIKDSGGGKWYFVPVHFMGVRANHSLYRHLDIQNTKEPLTFYSLNIEHSGTLHIEIKNSSNIRIFGSKTENRDYPVYKFNNSNNIFLLGFGGHAGTLKSTYSLFESVDSENITLALLTHIKRDQDNITNGDLIIESFYGNKTNISQAHNLISLFKRGEYNDSIFIPIEKEIIINNSIDEGNSGSSSSGGGSSSSSTRTYVSPIKKEVVEKVQETKEIIKKSFTPKQTKQIVKTLNLKKTNSKNYTRYYKSNETIEVSSLYQIPILSGSSSQIENSFVVIDETTGIEYLAELNGTEEGYALYELKEVTPELFSSNLLKKYDLVKETHIVEKIYEEHPVATTVSLSIVLLACLPIVFFIALILYKFQDVLFYYRFRKYNGLFDYMKNQNTFLEEDFKHYLNSIYNLIQLNKNKSNDYIRYQLEEIGCNHCLIDILLSKRK